MAQIITEINCVNCNTLLSVEGIDPLSRVSCPICSHENLVPLIVANYKIISMIGTGGQGTVYRAMDTSLQRIIAVKLLKKDLASDQEFITNFAREARAAAMVTHPCVVQIYSFGEDDGEYYLAMELMEKGNLDERIDAEGRINVIDVLQIGVQIASGLRAAFEKNLIHRDIKPGNILFDDHMQAKLVDFGLATVEGANPNQEIWGTPYYISPEKLSGGHEDFRSDIYSLGATLFHAIAGRPPFEGEDASEIVAKHMQSHAVSLQAFAPFVSDETAYVINKMLNKNPFERYNSYDELIEHLTYAREQLEIKFQNPQAAQKPVFTVIEEPGKNPFVLWGIAGMAVVVLAMLIFVGMNYKMIFGLEQARPVDAGSQAIEKEKVSPEVRDAWQRAAEFIGQGLFAEAAEELERLKEKLPVSPDNSLSQWLPLQLMACYYGMGESQKVNQLTVDYKAGSVDITAKISKANLTAEILKTVTSRRNSNDENNWLAAQDREYGKMTAFYLGMKALSVRNFDRAAELFNLVDTLPVSEEWIKKTTAFAKKFISDYDLFQKAQQQITSVTDVTSAQAAIETISETMTQINYPDFVESLSNYENDLRSRFPEEAAQ